MGKQAPAETGSPKASRSKDFKPKTLIEKSKRAAGIEPASSAWKAEVLPLNYARTSTDVRPDELTAAELPHLMDRKDTDGNELTCSDSEPEMKPDLEQIRT